MNHARLAQFALVLVACAAPTPSAPPPAPAPSLPAELAVAPLREPDPVQRLLDSLPLRAKAAQLVMPWIPGTYAAADDPGFLKARAWVDSLQVGGIIASIGSPLDIAAKLNADARIDAYVVESENFESIHNHSAYAMIRKNWPAC